jgi:histone acetyltransferase (RNA polymerase elongator complex component)
VAFYGGSFSALDTSLQQAYLRRIAPYRRAGRVAGVRVSTRPDACPEEAVALLRSEGVTTVELGCQSFSPAVLRRARRGHGPEAIGPAVSRLRRAGLRVGLQLMPGLPGGDDREARDSLTCALALRPDFLRIYPTVVLAGTQLERSWRQGDFQPLTLRQAVTICAELFWRCRAAGVPVIRLGLQSVPELDSGRAVLSGPYHPAFGQLVKSWLWRRALLRALLLETGLEACVHAADLSDARGHRNANLAVLRRRYKMFDIVADDAVERGSFVVQGRIFDLMEWARYLQKPTATAAGFAPDVRSNRGV